MLKFLKGCLFVECPKCKTEFKATPFRRGVCGNCGNRYDWVGDGGGMLPEGPVPVFASEPEEIKSRYLKDRKWV